MKNHGDFLVAGRVLVHVQFPVNSIMAPVGAVEVVLVQSRRVVTLTETKEVDLGPSIVHSHVVTSVNLAESVIFHHASEKCEICGVEECDSIAGSTCCVVEIGNSVTISRKLYDWPLIDV